MGYVFYHIASLQLQSGVDTGQVPGMCSRDSGDNPGEIDIESRQGLRGSSGDLL